MKETMKIRFLQIEPTTRCNYTCGFCAGRHMPQNDLDFAKFESFLSRLEGVEHIELQGEGEPLLHPDFFAMIVAARRRFPGVGISMISNGSLFTTENISKILDSGITRIFVSMESADDDRFQAIRGGKLERVRRGIRALLAARQARAMDLPSVGIAVTVLHSTIDEVFDTITPLYRELGLDGGINIQPLQGMPQYVQYYDEAMRAEFCTPEDGRHFEARMQQSVELRQAMQERLRQPGFYERLYASTGKKAACPWLENGLYVAQDGAVLPCCHVKDAARFALGHIAGDWSLIQTRRSAMAARLAAGQVPPACTGCRLAHGVAAANTAARKGA